MKRLKFKKWVTEVLFTIMLLLFVSMGAECESTLLFVISKVIAILGILGIGCLLNRYANFEG